MKNFLIKLLLRRLILGIFIISPQTSFGQTFQKGWEAFEAGDYAGTLEELRPLAEKGDLQSQAVLCAMFLLQTAVPWNATEVVSWCKAAAEQGNPAAQYSLGMLFLDGRNVEKDPEIGAKWIGLAAQQGHPMAQTRLGLLHIFGIGVPQDDVSAVRWFRLASVNGAVDAQLMLGAMYEAGRGVSKDTVKAYMWFNIAASQGDEQGGRSRDELEKKMLPSDISEAQKLSRECTASNVVCN